MTDTTAADAMHRTHRWAERSLAARGDAPQALFGIVQGACFDDLRQESAATLTRMPFDGPGLWAARRFDLQGPRMINIGACAAGAMAIGEAFKLVRSGLASVVLHSDFRDYYSRHGGEGLLKLFGGKDADLTFSLSDEQWGDVRQRDPWTLFRGRFRSGRNQMRSWHLRKFRCLC